MFALPDGLYTKYSLCYNILEPTRCVNLHMARTEFLVGHCLLLCVSHSAMVRLRLQEL